MALDRRTAALATAPRCSLLLPSATQFFAEITSGFPADTDVLLPEILVHVLLNTQRSLVGRAFCLGRKLNTNMQVTRVTRPVVYQSPEYHTESPVGQPIANKQKHLLGQRLPDHVWEEVRVSTDADEEFYVVVFGHDERLRDAIVTVQMIHNWPGTIWVVTAVLPEKRSCLFYFAAVTRIPRAYCSLRRQSPCGQSLVHKVVIVSREVNW